MPKNENQVFHCVAVESDTISVRTDETSEPCAFWFDVRGGAIIKHRITVGLSDEDAVSITLQMVDILRGKGLWVAAHADKTMLRKVMEAMLQPTFDAGWISGAGGVIGVVDSLTKGDVPLASAVQTVRDAVRGGLDTFMPDRINSLARAHVDETKLRKVMKAMLGLG